MPRAVHIDLDGAFDETSLGAVAGKDQPVVIYCMGPRCLRSSQAYAQAIAWGLARAHYFRNGFPAWKAAGYLVEVPEEPS